jgi:arsenate reductase
MHQMDYVITLCGHADQTCPATPPDVKRIHWPIEDPVGAKGTDEEVLNEFRRARDEIKKRIEDFLRDEGIV